MPLAPDLARFLRQNALERFLRYVAVHTTSDEDSQTHPSTARQRDLADLLRAELVELGLREVEVDEHAYVYATLPATPGTDGTPLTLLAHLDVSSAVPGDGVRPLVRENYDGGPLHFPEDPDLVLDPAECPELLLFKGQDLITASGRTLLGADDKAGIAAILAMLAAFQRHPELRHPELRLCFTPDEEIGQGTACIRLEKLGKVGYTVDGGLVGELESECFDARGARLRFLGNAVHPGESKNRMVNAGAIAARFLAALPEAETPEHTELREGFFHLTRLSGAEAEAELQFIVRDFEPAKNDRRIALLRTLREEFLVRYPGLKIDLEVKEQYRNMREVLERSPTVVQAAERAMEQAGVKVLRKAIRGGTDGARLSYMGLPTPNVFAGGLLFHSRKEWIPVVAFEKCAQVLVHLSAQWADRRL